MIYNFMSLLFDRAEVREKRINVRILGKARQVHHVGSQFFLSTKINNSAVLYLARTWDITKSISMKLTFFSKKPTA